MTKTPLMEQYFRIKSLHKEAILFFRMGDFYEMFYDDARIASKVLGLTLTTRSHGKAANVPLAGFPHHSLEIYLNKMLKSGYKVAICEQVEDPKKAKGIVKRAVVETISPGTAFSDKLLDVKSNNYLFSLFFSDGVAGFSAVDISTGEFLVSEGMENEVIEQINIFNPSEILISESQDNYLSEKLKGNLNIFKTVIEDYPFSYDYAYNSLKNHFKTTSLKGFGIEELRCGISAAGGILEYLKKSQVENLAHIKSIKVHHITKYMILDSSTRRNLELITPMSNSVNKEGTLISIIDKTLTPMGGRKLKKWLLTPLKNIKEIEKRLKSVDELFKNRNSRKEVGKILYEISDIERIIAKISSNKANARDLIGLKKSLIQIPLLKRALNRERAFYTGIAVRKLNDLKRVVNEIDKSIVENPPTAITEGGIIKEGYNKELDDLRKLAYSGKKWINNLQNLERKRTGIPSLKVSYNKVFGYYIEVTKPHLSKVPENYIRKQTLVNAERFITPELKEYEEKVLNAEEKINSLEYEIFQSIRKKIMKEITSIQKNADIISEIDVIRSFAEVSEENNYVRPKLTNESLIYIKDGRHPVVEKMLPPGEQFIPNDLVLKRRDEQIHIITGPNMAGKSTFLRQVGLIVLLAQIGSFVPASEAKIGIVDRIFTRVGASDNLARGESTFLVEMNELANILHNATPKSLILLDEIGRGTSTFDGLSIAWATAEFIHNNPKISAMTLFATHYHELTELERLYSGIKNYNVTVKEWGDSVIFLRKIERGGCDHSYGIQVARMAGVPPEVIERSKEILSNLEANELTPDHFPKLALKKRKDSYKENPFQINIFTMEKGDLEKELEKINPDKLTPLEALEKIYKLKKMCEGENS
ncbi:DNA mismatch repair protein MutS [candidate division KSB1 bacterium]|nr:MAG: DNA mismatch repair protein MutS [candidate division KSB1 bacterium]